MKKIILIIVLIGLIIFSGCVSESGEQATATTSEDTEGQAAISGDSIPSDRGTPPPTGEYVSDSTTHAPEEWGEDYLEGLGIEGKTLLGKGSADLLDAEDGVAAWISKDIVVQVIDISDTENPSHTGTIETPGFASAITSDGEYLYVTNSQGLTIYDVDDPFGDAIGSYRPPPENPSWFAAITVDNGYAYIAADGLMILDVKDPTNPTKVSHVTVTGVAASKIIVKENYAYMIMGLGGLLVMNISDKQNPRELGFHSYESHEAGFDIKGNYAYVAHVSGLSSEGLDYEFTSVLEVIDISDPESLNVVATLSVPTNFKGLSIEEDYAYISGSHPHSLTIVDISDPRNPQILEVGGQMGGNLKKIFAKNSYVYLLDSGYGLKIFDLRDSSQAVQAGDVDLQQMLSTFYVKGNKAYLIGEQRYFSVADVSDPENPVLAYSEATPSSPYPYTSVDIENGVAFTNSYYSAYYDVTDPYNPKRIEVDLGMVDGIQVRGNYFYSVVGEVGLLITDITDLHNPRSLSVTNFVQGMCRDFSIDGDWAVCVANKPYSINLMDISDPENPVPKGGHVYDEYVVSVAINNGYVYASLGHGGVDIFRIDSAGELEFLTNYPGNGYKVIFEGDKAYVMSSMDVLDVSNPANPVKLGVIKGVATGDIALSDGYFYLADGERGVYIVPQEV